MADFAHLHVHTDHSPLDGHASVDELARYIASMGQPGFAITDHGTQSNVYNGYKSAKAISKELGKPFYFLPGVEAYVAPGDASRYEHAPIFFGKDSSNETKTENSKDVAGGGAYTHLTMLSYNNEGMRNLFKLNSLAWLDGQYRKPRMDIDIISQHAKGIVATTGCPSGELQTRIRLGQFDEAVKYAGKMQDIFGKENYFVELMDHDMRIGLERDVRNDLLRISKKLEIPLVATNDLHYTRREDAPDHEHMLAIQSGYNMHEPSYGNGGKRFAFEGEEYYAKSTEEMLKLFPEDVFPGAITNSAEIVKRSEVTFDYDETLRPSVPLPKGHDEHSFLREQVMEGLYRKRPQFAHDKEYLDRIEVELGVLREKNFSGYMLVVSDFIVWAKKNSILVGPGRGCLSGDTLIPTTQGHKAIRDIQVGDFVFDQNGEAVEIPRVWEWDCDEELISISSYYGANPIKMTRDHKVLVSKANRNITRQQKAQGYSYNKDKNPLQWIRADEVELGDLVVTPKIKYGDSFRGITIETESIAQTNIKSNFSTRAIAKNLGMSRSAVMSFFQNPERSKLSTKQKIESYLLSLGISIDEAIEHRKIHSIAPCDPFIPANKDLGIILGLFISDGHLRSRGHEIGFAQKRSEDEEYIPNVFKRVFGLDMSVQESKNTDVRSYLSSHKGIVEAFKNLFPKYSYTAQSKYIPAELMNSSEEFRRGLLEGLWYGDGTHKGKSSYSTTSKELAQNVHMLLVSLGINSGINEHVRVEHRKEYNKSGRTSYIEYKVTSAREFNTSRVINGMGSAYDGEFMYQRVRKIETVPSEGKVYDFRVDTTMSYVTESFVVHNSGGGSLVAFLTDITEIDPIEHGLIFERFLNPERDSPPDIDTDFADIDRERVIEYVRQKYGNDQIAMIITFGLIKAKSAVKDMTKILSEPYSVGESLTKAMPPAKAGREISLKEIFDPEASRYPEAEEFRQVAETLSNRKLIPGAMGIEGKLRQTGVHAAGVIMSGKPIINTIPLMMRKKDEVVITQFDYPTCEDLGLIKMDFLGLRNLTVIQKTIDAVKRNYDVVIEPNKIYDSALSDPDPKAFELLNNGGTLGIFQLDSGGIASLVKYINVDSFRDISAILALYRPGPMGVNAHIMYADRKNGRAPIEPIHPELEEVLNPILGETYGLIAFQEQIQFIAQKVAGYSLGQADVLRRAMGKKKKAILDAEFIPFSEGMRKNGYSDEAIGALWETLIPFAEYGFNKCLHGRTRVVLENGRAITLEDLHKEFDSGEQVKILSMFEDGEIKPHLIKDVVKSGLKPIWTLRTKSGRMIKMTEDHRLLTTQGYGTIKDGILRVGQELIVESEKKTFHISEQDRLRRRNSITVLNKTEQSKEFARQRMKEYQSTLSFEDRSAHQQRVQKLNPSRNAKGQPLAIEKLKELWSTDKEWQSKALDSMRKVKRELYNTGKGFGRTTLLSDGRMADSMVEAIAAEYLISRGVEFEMHKKFEATNGKIRETDFYADGIYFEMDGLARGREWFVENKYGSEIPFVYLTPLNYVDEIDSAIMRHGIENGDEIIEIIPPKMNKRGESYREMTYDIEMDSSGPANFIANGIVSHNSHSAAYGLVSYMTAYLKANYGAEFMAANLSTLTGDKEKTATYLAECRHMNIKVLPPDVSRSTADYTATPEGEILVGLHAIRGVGIEVSNDIFAEVEKNGVYSSLGDFLNRAPSNALTKGVLEGLIHAGALDNFGYNRKSLFYSVPGNVKNFAQARKKKDAGQFDLFDAFGGDDALEKPSIEVEELTEYNKKTKLSYERHALGLYVSDHPLSGIANMLEKFSDTQAVDVFSGKVKPSSGGFGDRKNVRMAGVAGNVVRKQTKSGGFMVIFELEDISGVMECLIFPKAYERLGNKVHADTVYEIHGSLLSREGDDGVKLVVDNLEEIKLTESGLIPFSMNLYESQTVPEAVKALEEVLLRYPGEMPVHLNIYNAKGECSVIELDSRYNVGYTKSLDDDLRLLFGSRVVS